MGNARRLAIISTLALAGGCATTGGKVTAIIGGVTAIGTVISVSQGPASCREDAGLCFHSVATSATLGVTAGVALFASFLFEVLGAPDLPAPPPSPVPTGPPGAPGKPIAAGDDYLPLNLGGLFSTNAAAASR